MAKFTKVLLAAVLATAACPSFAKDTTYRDPRNPSFSLLVPDGWTASRTNSGVSVSHGYTTVILLASTGNRPPADMVADIESQMQKQAKNFHEISKGACQFGRQKGAYTQFLSTGPNGTTEIARVVSMTNGQIVYTMIEEVKPEQYNDEKQDLQRIEDSFSPEAIATSVDDREKLDALYAAGVINQQEYEARKRNLGGSAASAPPPPAGAANSGNRNSGTGSDANAQKLAALEQAYRSGVLTKDEYESKKRQLEGNGSAQASPYSGANGNYGGGDTRFHAPDGSYSTVIPPGWTSQHVGSGAQATDTFSPSNGGEDRIIISGMPATMNIQQMMTGLATITTRMFPSLQLTQAPAYGQLDGNPAAELRYQGTLANGAKISAWQGVRLISGRYYSVFSVSQWERAFAVETDAQTMLRNLRPEQKR